MSARRHAQGTLTADWMMAGYGREARRMETLNAEGFGTIALAYSPEDARRLCAVWNACAGLSTEALEAGALGEALNELRACLRLLQHPDVGFAGNPGLERSVAALAKLEGK